MILLSTILLALSAIIIPTLAQTVEFTNTDFTDITPGENFLVTWSGDGDPVRIALLTGSTDAGLVLVSTIASNQGGTQLNLPIPAIIPPGNYALSITQDGVTSYSPIFAIGPGGSISSVGSMPPSSSTSSPPAAASSSISSSPAAASSSTPNLIAAAPTSSSAAAASSSSAMPTAMMISSRLVNGSPIPTSSGILGPPPIVASPSGVPSLGFSSPTFIGTVGTGTGTGDPYTAGYMNGSRMGNITATVAVVTGTVTIECPSSSGSVALYVPLAPSTILEFTGGVGGMREGLVGYMMVWLMIMGLLLGTCGL